MDLMLDFETYCDLNLKTVGARKYTEHPSFKPLCLNAREFDPLTGHKGQKFSWNFQENIIPDLSGHHYYWAMNAYFDWLVNLKCLERNLFFGIPSSIDSWKDGFVLFSKFSLPQKLEGAANVLKTKHRKNPRGPLIINRCCKKNSKIPTQEDYEELFSYCEDDVEASINCIHDCPSAHIGEEEWEMWRDTCYMNYTGLTIDFPAVRAIKERIDMFKEVALDMLPEVTNGKVSTPGQIAKIKEFLKDNGVDLPNLQAATLEALDLDSLPEACRMVITIRMATGASSVGKFNTLIDMELNGRNHDYIRYGATNTQRWAGSGFQIHSLPKASVENPEDLIQRFLDNGEIENPIKAGRALCRSVIKAPENLLWYQGDYSNIEYVILIWLTGMTQELQRFRDGFSAYIDMAAFLYNKKYNEIDKHAIDNLEYFLGKQVILGCGYCMGTKRFQETCKKYGADISWDEADRAVHRGYRVKYKPVVDFWKKVQQCAVAAIKNPGQKFKAYKCGFLVARDHKGTDWLVIKLPSGTNLYYHSPKLSPGKYSLEISHMGMFNHKWIKRWLGANRITENIVQKLARDLIGYGILEINRGSYEPVFEKSPFAVAFQAHDEVVSYGPEKNAATYHECYLKMLERKPEWAKEIPLKAGGFYGKRYKKD